MSDINPTIINQLWEVVDIILRNVNCESDLRQCELFFTRVLNVVQDLEEINIDIDDSTSSSSSSSMDYSSSCSSITASESGSDIDLPSTDNEVSLNCHSVLGSSPPPPPPPPPPPSPSPTSSGNDLNRLFTLMERLVVSIDTHNDIDDQLYHDIGQVFGHILDRFDSLGDANRSIINQIRTQSMAINNLIVQLNLLWRNSLREARRNDRSDGEDDY
uniref:Uncharacterized protein n=1 Tax=Tetranychus urticae TaxID=32264 RepID=T1L638_TETUR